MCEAHQKVVQKMWEHLYFLLTFNKKQTNSFYRRKFPQNTLFRSLRTSHFPLRTSTTLFGSFYPDLRLIFVPKLAYSSPILSRKVGFVHTIPKSFFAFLFFLCSQTSKHVLTITQLDVNFSMYPSITTPRFYHELFPLQFRAGKSHRRRICADRRRQHQ